VRLMPKAKLSSRPLNHLARAVVMATMSGSDPIPRSSRAMSITVRSVLTALRMPANVQIEAKKIVDLTVPNLSITSPPMSRTNTAAME